MALVERLRNMRQATADEGANLIESQQKEISALKEKVISEQDLFELQQ